MARGPILIINCKNYAEVATRARMRRLLDASVKVAAKYNVSIAVAPPQHMLGEAVALLADMHLHDAGTGSGSSANGKTTGSVILLAQHADCKGIGSTTGHVIPEMLRRAGVAGSIVNHSEHRVDKKDAACIVSRLRENGMLSVLCVRNAGEAKRYAGMAPDYMAVEPPELIGSGRAVSTERPGLISATAAVLKDTDAGLLCGAGIVSDADVSRAVELGARGILVASGIIKNDTRWNSAITGLARPLAQL